MGPGSPYLPPESLHAKPGQRMEGYVFPKVTFALYLPDDPKIERLVFLLAHPDGTKYRLEEVGSLELDAASRSKLLQWEFLNLTLTSARS